MTKPYKDYKKSQSEFYRRFECDDLEEEELVWHRDKSDREVYVVDGYGWKFQYENKMPFEIKQGDYINIDKMSYHRLIKGDTNLILKITEKE